MLAWYRYCLSKYFTFSGRASRAEYWSFTGINLLIYFVFCILAAIFDVGGVDANGYPVSSPAGVVLGTIFFFYEVAIIFPALAVTTRRLHDRDHSAAWLLAVLIPLLNLVVLLFMLLPSSPRPNDYGDKAPASPTGTDTDAEDGNKDNTDAQPAQTDSLQDASETSTGTTMKTETSSDQMEDRTSVLDELMKENLPNADVQAGIEESSTPAASKSANHRSVPADESSFVERLKKMSQK